MAHNEDTSASLRKFSGTRVYSNDTNTLTHTGICTYVHTIIDTQIYETFLFVAAISMMLSNDLPQQYEVGNTARHFT